MAATCGHGHGLQGSLGSREKGGSKPWASPCCPGRGLGAQMGTARRAAPAVSPRTRPSCSVGTRQPHSHSPRAGHGHVCWRWWPGTAQGSGRRAVPRAGAAANRETHCAGSSSPSLRSRGQHHLHRPPVLPGELWVLTGPSPAPALPRHRHRDGDSTSATGHPTAAPRHAAAGGVTEPASLWGGHGAHAQAPVPLAQRGKEGPRYLPEFLLQQEPIPST